MLRGAVACAVLFVLSYAGAFHVEPAQGIDRDLVSVSLDVQEGTPAVYTAARAIVHLLLPQVILGLSAVAVAIALWRRAWPLAVAAAATVVAANVLTQALQVLTWVPRGHEELAMEQSRWPSGHAAGITAMAFAATMAAPPAWRRVVGTVAGIVVTIDCLSIFVIHWHFPSDVASGVLLGVAVGLGSWAAAAAWPSRTRRSSGAGHPRAVAATPPVKGPGPLSGSG